MAPSNALPAAKEGKLGDPDEGRTYARVSTVNGGQDPEMQLRELREYVVNRGWTAVGEFVDRISGSKDSRPALTRFMADVHQRKCDVVLVWKLDRWGRSLRHLVNSMAELEARGVAFISLRDNLDLTTPAGRLMFQVIGAMAEFERSLIQERVKAGLRNAKAKGTRLGRPQVIVDSARIGLLARGASRGETWHVSSAYRSGQFVEWLHGAAKTCSHRPQQPVAFQQPIEIVSVRRNHLFVPHSGWDWGIL